MESVSIAYLASSLEKPVRADTRISKRQTRIARAAIPNRKASCGRGPVLFGIKLRDLI
jgi:hypothetical protein